MADRRKAHGYNNGERMMYWNDFEQNLQVEQTVFDLTRQSLASIAQSSLGDEKFHCFAFNVGAADGSIMLSLATQADRREGKLYPPEWDYEVVESDVPEIASLWRAGYAAVETAYAQQVEDFGDDFDALDAFEEGFLQSLRRVMVRLEQSNAFAVIGAEDGLWTLVTQIDADTDEEERLLDAVRRGEDFSG